MDKYYWDCLKHVLLHTTALAQCEFLSALKSNGPTIGQITISIPVFHITATCNRNWGRGDDNGKNPLAPLLYRLKLITLQYLRFPYSDVGCS